jgi:hypothetical protein
MKNIPFLFISLLMLAACYRDVPPNQVQFDMTRVLPADSMIIVLTDLQIVEGAVNVQHRQKLQAGVRSNAYLETVLEKHNITLDQVEESMRYYSYHTKELDKIYDQVIINLSKKEGELMNEAKDSQ